MLAALRTRLVQLKAAPALVMNEAAPLIADRLRRDATTKRGNVPPISVEVRPQAIAITAPDYVIEKAQKKGQIEVWVDIVRESARRVMAR